MQSLIHTIVLRKAWDRQEQMRTQCTFELSSLANDVRYGLEEELQFCRIGAHNITGYLLLDWTGLIG